MAWIIGMASQSEIEELEAVGHQVEVIDTLEAVMAIEGRTAMFETIREAEENLGNDRWIRYAIDCDASVFGLYKLSNEKF